MPILYDNPKEVGADRIANAVAAFDLYGGPTIVVDFGTATTFDAISANGEYLGGAIAPGIEISLDALFGRAAALRRVELVEPRNVIGRTTVESIQSGAVYGFAAAGRRHGRPHRGRARRCTVVATGGLAGLITPLSVDASSTTSPGSRCTACASSTRRTGDRPAPPTAPRPRPVPVRAGPTAPPTSQAATPA